MRKQNNNHHHRPSHASRRRHLCLCRWLNLAKRNSVYSADTDSTGNGSDSEQADFCDRPRASRFKNDKLQVDDNVYLSNASQSRATTGRRHLSLIWNFPHLQNFAGSKMRKQSNNQQQEQVSRRRVGVRAWLNLVKNKSDYSGGPGSDSEQDFCDWPKESRFKNDKADELQSIPRLRRRNSETFRAQYINNKEIRIFTATWNVGGRVPPDDLDIDDWLGIEDPADIYVIGLQEVIPLNAGNIFGVEDSRPVPIWENIIRKALNRVPPATKLKSYSDPPSPSRFRPSEYTPSIEDEIVLEFDSDVGEESHLLNEDPIFFDDNDIAHEFDRQFSSPRRLARLKCLRIGDDGENNNKLTKTLSGTERIGLSWPEPPLHLLPQHVLEKPSSFNSVKSFRHYGSFKANARAENRTRSDIRSHVELNLESLINSKRRPPYVRIVSKQMVGIFITVWVRRSLRRHIQNLNVSTVGVGVMGYIGNKGSISVSMSVHQTLFCFVCTHLSSGEKDADAVKRNVDVHEIHRRTRFNSLSATGLPRKIYDHKRIIWMGDLNYRINLSYEQTRKLISKKDWSKLVEKDQLIREFEKGRAFDGWSEGGLSFAPTYKYELNSESYFGEDPKAGRRTPAWCDRILSFGSGMKLLSYRRSEALKLSDHRPVTASYMVEVEVFCSRKLQRALTFTDAEIEEQDDMDMSYCYCGRMGLHSEI